MGPRSIERGNSLLNSQFGADLKLQWGRARSSAEIFKRQVPISGYTKASMGPRSIERGNADLREHKLLVFARFNGAALDRARK